MHHVLSCRTDSSDRTRRVLPAGSRSLRAGLGPFTPPSEVLRTPSESSHRIPNRCGSRVPEGCRWLNAAVPALTLTDTHTTLSSHRVAYGATPIPSSPSSSHSQRHSASLSGTGIVQRLVSPRLASPAATNAVPDRPGPKQQQPCITGPSGPCSEFLSSPPSLLHLEL